MRRMKLVALAALAVLALSAVVASAAQAEPEFKKESGSVAGVTIKTTSGTGEMKAGSSIKVTCTSDESSGEVTGAKTVGSIVVTFSGCEAKEGSGEACKAGSSEGAETGTITTNSLKGKLVETEVGTKVGLLLEPTVGTTYVTLYAKCLALHKTTVTGSIVGEVSPLETYATTGKLEYKLSGSKQAIRTYVYEGVEHTGAVLKAFSLLETPLVTSETVTFGEALKVT
jgi:hypothetical protein